MVITALFKTAKTRKQPKWPSTDEWIKKIWCACVCVYMESHERMIFCHLQQHGWTWNLEIIILSEVSQKGKDKYDIIYMWNLKYATNELIFRYRPTDVENRFMSTKRKREGGKVRSSVQFSRSVVSDSLWHHEPQHARPPCPSPTAGVYSNSCPLSQWCHPTISSSVVPFSCCPQSFPASGSFQMSQFFITCGQSIGVSASTSVLPTRS